FDLSIDALMTRPPVPARPMVTAAAINGAPTAAPIPVAHNAAPTKTATINIPLGVFFMKFLSFDLNDSFGADRSLFSSACCEVISFVFDGFIFSADEPAIMVVPAPSTTVAIVATSKGAPTTAPIPVAHNAAATKVTPKASQNAGLL